MPADPIPGRRALAAAGVGVEVAGHWLVRDVDLDVEHGELVAVIGPNGAGKSTLLRVLAGDRRPDEGTAWVDDRPTSTMPALELARRRAVLPQRTTVAFPFTVREIITMGCAPWRATARDGAEEDAVEAAAERTDVAHLLGRTFTTLSGGEQARVALARVLAQDTRTLLLDEPTAALDLRHQELVMRLAREQAGQRRAVLVVLHDLGLAAAYADRVALLDRGRLVACGPPHEVLDAQLLSEVYEHEVEVATHPRTGALLVSAYRRGRPVDVGQPRAARPGDGGGGS